MKTIFVWYVMYECLVDDYGAADSEDLAQRAIREHLSKAVLSNLGDEELLWPEYQNNYNGTRWLFDYKVVSVEWKE